MTPATRILGALTALALTLLLTACSDGGEVMNPGNGHHSDRPAKEVLATMLKRVQVTVEASGSAEWRWDDKSAWNGPGDRGGFIGQSCGRYGVQRYTVDLFGPPQPDPAAALQKVAAAWKAHGWKVRVVVPPKAGIRGYLGEIAVDFRDGAGLGYQASDLISGITAQSECTTDPAMNQRTE